MQHEEYDYNCVNVRLQDTSQSKERGSNRNEILSDDEYKESVSHTDIELISNTINMTDLLSARTYPQACLLNHYNSRWHLHCLQYQMGEKIMFC
jgi:hypothetical protein